LVGQVFQNKVFLGAELAYKHDQFFHRWKHMILSIDAVCFFLKMMSEILVRKEKFENKIKSNFKGKQKVRRERKLFDVK
jgi:hypothetical protein